VAVNCPEGTPWTLFVPAIIRQEFVVISAAQNIERGKTLTVTDLRTEKRLLTEPPPGAIQTPESLLGQVTQRALAAGTVFTGNIVKPRQIVRRGQAVTLSLVTGSIAIAVTGTALQPGGIGDRIPVRNNNSRKVIEGIIQPSGEVVVDGGGTGSLP
jgi:flagella basal body P-ring formation protein FlgA